MTSTTCFLKYNNYREFQKQTKSYMERDDTLYTLIIFSENLPGVLNHITTIFTRRQINIESLNVSASSIEGLHRYTITCYATECLIKKITKQIEKIIDVVSANYFTENEIFTLETALYKLSTPAVLENREISKVIRIFGAKIVEVNSTYSIVTMEGLTEEITNLYKHLKILDCVLQFVHSGSIAVTKSRREFVSEFIESRNRKRFGMEE